MDALNCVFQIAYLGLELQKQYSPELSIKLETSLCLVSFLLRHLLTYKTSWWKEMRTMLLLITRWCKHLKLGIRVHLQKEIFFFPWRKNFHLSWHKTKRETKVEWLWFLLECPFRCEWRANRWQTLKDIGASYSLSRKHLCPEVPAASLPDSERSWTSCNAWQWQTVDLPYTDCCVRSLHFSPERLTKPKWHFGFRRTHPSAKPKRVYLAFCRLYNEIQEAI